MSKIVIGKSSGRNIVIDPAVLLKTRALIQAGSGGGKSYFLRRLAEQLFGKIQTFIIDREGEFASLRERYGFVLAGHDGDTATDVRSARLLAEKLLELRASAVCDLYESFRKTPSARRAWVRGFLEGVMDAPKKFWRPLVVIVDEAHLFAPQESPKAASMVEREIISGCKEAMVALATAGRKRGFCAVWATQRLAKLDKDASAELLNRFVGQTIEDVDVDRAADLMSVSRDEKAQFKKEIKNLEPGNFYGFGRAVSKDRILIRVGPVKTTHPESGSTKYATAPPPAPEKIRGLLPKLKDLPGEAEQKVKTEGELRKEIASLRTELIKERKVNELVSRKAPEPKVETKIRELPVLSAKDQKRFVQLLGEIRHLTGTLEHTETLKQLLRSFDQELGAKLESAIQAAQDLRQGPTGCPTGPKGQKGARGGMLSPRQAIRHIAAAPKGNDGLADAELLKGERKMLGVLAQFSPGSRTRSQLGALTGLTPSGGTFGNYYGRLRKKGYIEQHGDGSITITPEGLALFGDSVPSGPQTPEELVEMWRGKLLRGERDMLDAVMRHYPNALTREELGAEVGKAHRGGTFGNYLGTLRRNQLVVVNGDTVKAADVLFETVEAR